MVFDFASIYWVQKAGEFFRRDELDIIIVYDIILITHKYISQSLNFIMLLSMNINDPISSSSSPGAQR